MSVTEKPVYHSANLAMFMVNVSQALMRPMRAQWPAFSVNDLKAWFRGRKYVVETLLLSLGTQYEQRGMRAQKVILQGPFSRPPTLLAHSSAPSRCSCEFTEALGPLLGAKTPRDLLVQLHHADVSLCLVVVKGHV